MRQAAPKVYLPRQHFHLLTATLLNKGELHCTDSAPNITCRAGQVRVLLGVCLIAIFAEFTCTLHQGKRLCLGIGTGDRFICDTGLSIAVNQSKTRPPSTRFCFLCMHRVPGGVIKLSAPTSSLASQCLPSATIKHPFQNLSSLVPCPLSLCPKAF